MSHDESATELYGDGELPADADLVSPKAAGAKDDSAKTSSDDETPRDTLLDELPEGYPAGDEMEGSLP